MMFSFDIIVANLAVFTTILQFLSGILVCKQYIENRTTGEASPLPFICGIVSTALWFLYGFLKPDYNIVFVNSIGFALMTVYTIVFYIYTVKKWSVLKQLTVIVLFLAFIFVYSTVAEDYDLLLKQLGFLACTLTLVAIGAPMVKLVYVIRVRSTECLPFPMILMSFFVSLLWFLYGIIEDDIFLTLPNFIGGALAMSQLSLFVIYPSKSVNLLP